MQRTLKIQILRAGKIAASLQTNCIESLYYDTLIPDFVANYSQLVAHTNYHISLQLLYQLC